MKHESNAEEALYWLRLVCASGVSAANARTLLAQIGLPQEIFAASEGTLARHIGQEAARALKASAKGEDEGAEQRVKAALAWLSQSQEPTQATQEVGVEHSLLTLADSDYPKALLEIADPPVLLYVKGSRSLLNTPCVAMVGSRNTTPQGEKNAEVFAKALVEAGVSVVSGMAWGIDAASHRGALQARHQKASTIAVIGTGIDRVYPARNHELAKAIAQQGLILSEFALGTPPLQANFPRRNRLISGLSRGVLVVEAALQSGSLITARLAGEQGREVMAIPGSIHSPMSRGCHALIKQGAKLVESAEDVLEELHLQAAPALSGAMTHEAQNVHEAPAMQEEQEPHEGEALNQAETSEGKLLATMGYDPMDVDEISRRTGLGAAALSAQLLELELMGKVARLSGGFFQRITKT